MTNHTPAPMRFTTVKEVSRLLRVSKMTVYRLVDAKELDSVRVGRMIRIPTSSVLAYLNREQTAAPQLRAV